MMLGKKGRLSNILCVALIVLSLAWSAVSFVSPGQHAQSRAKHTALSMSSSTKGKGKLLVLGGTGFLGQTICRRALLEGYQVTSLSRRGLAPSSSDGASERSNGSSSSSGGGGTNSIDYRAGDARQAETISSILGEGGYVGVVHCIGLLLDDASGLGTYNRFVSGSGSVPDENSSYDAITRLTAFNAIDSTIRYVQNNNNNNDDDNEKPGRFPFVFTSAAEAGWPDVPGGRQIEEFLAPEWLRRYLVAKRAVESKLLGSNGSASGNAAPTSSAVLRPIIVRPSLIYSLDRPASYVPVGAFFVGNKVGLPFVDRPVTVQSLANAVVKAIGKDSTVEGVLRYPEIDALSS